MRERDLLITDKAELGKSDVFIVKNIKVVKACAAVIFSLLVFALLHTSISSKIEIAQANELHKSEVDCLLTQIDSIMACYDESIRVNDLHDAIIEAVMEGSHEKPTRDNVQSFIEKCNAWYPDIIMAQAVQESGCGVSDVGKRCNNLFGMAKPKSRKLRCDINRENKAEPFAEYHNWKMSVIDRIFWEKWMFRNTNGKPSRAEYLCKIENVYNTETKGYAAHIDNISKKYRTLK